MQFSKWVTLGFGALCLTLVAGVLNAQHLYYMAAILLTLPGVSYLLGWIMLRGLEFSRDLPPSAWDGEEGALIYVARNTSRFSRYFLTIREPLPDWITPLDAEPPLFNIPADDSTRVAHRVRFNKRGVYRVQSFDVTAVDPLGVFAFTRRVACDGELVVYPLPQKMRLLPLSGAENNGWQELTRMSLRGSSVDPDGVREYTPGDALRRIHWRQTARTGKLSVIEFEEAQSTNLVIVLDLLRGTDIGEGRETTLEYAVGLIASVAEQAVQQGASVRLILPADVQKTAAPSILLASQAGRGQQQLFVILDALAHAEATSTLQVGQVVMDGVGHLLPSTTLLVITAALDSALSATLTRYTATGANVAVVYIDPTTFAGGSKSASPALRDNFFAELVSARAQPFILRRNSQNDLYPEAVIHAESQSSEPIRA